MVGSFRERSEDVAIDVMSTFGFILANSVDQGAASLDKELKH